MNMKAKSLMIVMAAAVLITAVSVSAAPLKIESVLVCADRFWRRSFKGSPISTILAIPISRL